jgi:hypothetical protein
MQVVEPVSMETPHLIKVMHFFDDIVKNNITKTGCKWLSKAYWSKIDKINLCEIKMI